MAKVRDAKLDNFCESIGDERDTMNACKKEEKSLLASALQRMLDRNVSVYKHARVELVVVPGSAQIRCRLVKDDGDASVTGGTTAAQNGDGDGEGDEVPAAERGIGDVAEAGV